MESAPGEKRSRDEPAELDPPESPEAKRIRADLLADFLDDADADADDLATVMRSLEEEIAPPAPPPQGEDGPQPELGFLLEASDDELGLPPAAAPEAADDRVFIPDEDIGFGCEFGFGPELEVGPEEGLVFDGGLFDYPDELYGPSDLGEISWRSETLPAL